MPKKEIPLIIPPKVEEIDRWVILGLDPSMSRTGYALMQVQPPMAHTPEESYTEATWLTAGSVKPEKIENAGLHPRNTLWIRSKIMALYLREVVETIKPSVGGASKVGLIVSMEYPTPMNDYLTGLQRIINLVFFDGVGLGGLFSEIRILLTNASTLRSLMGLTQRGPKNKTENIIRAYTFIGKAEYPELDTDSCDAVLLGMMGRHTASIMLGCVGEVPQNFLNSLCNSTQEVKGKGRNAHVVTKGLLHRNELFYKYEKLNYGLLIKDASVPSKRLVRREFSI